MLLQAKVSWLLFYDQMWHESSDRILYDFQVLDALGVSLPCVKYDSWMVYIPEGEFLSRIGPTEFFKVDSGY